MNDELEFAVMKPVCYDPVWLFITKVNNLPKYIVEFVMKKNILPFQKHHTAHNTKDFIPRNRVEVEWKELNLPKQAHFPYSLFWKIKFWQKSRRTSI